VDGAPGPPCPVQNGLGSPEQAEAFVQERLRDTLPSNDWVAIFKVRHRSLSFLPPITMHPTRMCWCVHRLPTNCACSRTQAQLPKLTRSGMCCRSTKGALDKHTELLTSYIKDCNVMNNRGQLMQSVLNRVGSYGDWPSHAACCANVSHKMDGRMQSNVPLSFQTVNYRFLTISDAPYVGDDRSIEVLRALRTPPGVQAVVQPPNRHRPPQPQGFDPF
jgi:hypothetical protein